MEDPQEHNWIMDQSEHLVALEWGTRILDLSDGNHFWLALLATDAEDQWFWEGSQVLLATMTFTVDDTTTICLDSCPWPPTGQLMFCTFLGNTYIPRHCLPYCVSISQAGVGDCTADCVVDIGDVVYVINYLYLGGAAPYPVEVGDANCDGIVNIADVVFLINYLFRAGPPPSC
jgi:hypothetical protein